MKARQDFVVYIDATGNLVSHASGEPMDGKTRLEFKKGADIKPDSLVGDFLRRNPELLEIEYVNGRILLTEEQMKLYNLPEGKITTEPRIIPRKYSQESLTQLMNEKGTEELKKIAENDFHMTNVRASKTLITKILLAQEESRR